MKGVGPNFLGLRWGQLVGSKGSLFGWWKVFDWIWGVHGTWKSRGCPISWRHSLHLCDQIEVVWTPSSERQGSMTQAIEQLQEPSGDLDEEHLDVREPWPRAEGVEQRRFLFIGDRLKALWGLFPVGYIEGGIVGSFEDLAQSLCEMMAKVWLLIARDFYYYFIFLFSCFCVSLRGANSLHFRLYWKSLPSTWVSWTNLVCYFCFILRRPLKALGSLGPAEGCEGRGCLASCKLAQTYRRAWGCPTRGGYLNVTACWGGSWACSHQAASCFDRGYL